MIRAESLVIEDDDGSILTVSTSEDEDYRVVLGILEAPEQPDTAWVGLDYDDAIRLITRLRKAVEQ